MRLITLALVVAALAGCAHQRHHPKADGEQAATPAKAEKAEKTPPLPDGLIGDGEQHGYVEPPPRSS